MYIYNCDMVVVLPLCYLDTDPTIYHAEITATSGLVVVVSLRRIGAGGALYVERRIGARGARYVTGYSIV